MKNKKTIIILTLLLIIFVGADIFLVLANKPITESPNNSTPNEQSNQNENEDGIPIVKSVKCVKENANSYDDSLAIKFKTINEYSFLVGKNNRMFDNLDETTLIFDNSPDLNKYYDYITTVLTNDKFSGLQMSKNDQDLNIYYYVKTNWWGYEYYSDEYLNVLENKSGYTCEVQDL